VNGVNAPRAPATSLGYYYKGLLSHYQTNHLTYHPTNYGTLFQMLANLPPPLLNAALSSQAFSPLLLDTTAKLTTHYNYFQTRHIAAILKTLSRITTPNILPTSCRSCVPQIATVLCEEAYGYVGNCALPDLIVAMSFFRRRGGGVDSRRFVEAFEEVGGTCKSEARGN